MPGPAEVKRLFLSSPKFAVVGASKNQSKFGTKVGSLPTALRLIARQSTKLRLIHRNRTGSEMVPGPQQGRDPRASCTSSLSGAHSRHRSDDLTEGGRARGRPRRAPALRAPVAHRDVCEHHHAAQGTRSGSRTHTAPPRCSQIAVHTHSYR